MSLGWNGIVCLCSCLILCIPMKVSVESCFVFLASCLEFKQHCEDGSMGSFFNTLSLVLLWLGSYRVATTPHYRSNLPFPFLCLVTDLDKKIVGQRECVSSRFYFEKIEINSKIVLNINLFYVFNSLIKHIYVFLYIYICSISYINSIFKSAYLNCP